MGCNYVFVVGNILGSGGLSIFYGYCSDIGYDGKSGSYRFGFVVLVVESVKLGVDVFLYLFDFFFVFLCFVVSCVDVGVRVGFFNVLFFVYFG